MKLSDWRLEYTIVILVVFAVVLMFIPTSIKSTVQANFISKWKDNYGKLEYAQDAILKQGQVKILPGFNNCKTPEECEKIFIILIKPYFRINDTKFPKHYHAKYMNNSKIHNDSPYYVHDYFYTNNKVIVGIKDLPDERNGRTKFLMTFDVNGIIPPNRWGRDVFGVIVYPDKIEAIGADLPLDMQKDSCSPNSTGVACSNYYLIGGGFDD